MCIQEPLAEDNGPRHGLFSASFRIQRRHVVRLKRGAKGTDGGRVDFSLITTSRGSVFTEQAQVERVILFGPLISRSSSNLSLRGSRNNSNNNFNFFHFIFLCNLE